MALILIVRKPTSPQMLVQRPIFHNIKEAFMHKFTFTFVTKVWSPVKICSPAFLSTLCMIACIAPVTQNHVLVVGFPSTELAGAGIGWRPR